MSEQGGRPTGHEDAWWRQLYDGAPDDTGPAPAPDSLDDRFDSAADTVNEADGGPADGPVGGPAGGPADGPADGGPSAGGSSGTPPPAPGPVPGGGTPPARPPGARRSDGRAPRPPEGPPPAWPPPGRTTSATGFPAPPPPTPPAPTLTGASAGSRAPRPVRPVEPPPPPHGHVGSRPPTYDAEPTTLPAADPHGLDDLVPDTVLDGARYGTCTLRAASVRGDSARYRGEPRRDALLTARFGSGDRALVLVAVATGVRGTPGAHRAAAEACRWIGKAVGLSHARLAEDITAGRRGDLKSGLHRLTDRTLGRLRAGAAEQGLGPEAYAATLRCLLLPADPGCRTRVFFGVGGGGLFRLRDGAWQDIEPKAAEARGGAVLGFGSPPSETPEGDRLTMDLGIPTPPSPYEPAPEPPREPFRFRTSVARRGDTLLLCSPGLADPLRGEDELGAHLATRWSRPGPPGLAAFLADTQVRVKGYADDRTAAAVWEA
ncbi:protein phosphatase 2C domain-containing protein [Streptomyces prasinus]|uniref:protein phosphatase 2C domain-containing protein n=1 Tax=Streptomyces prasinus TaxID=67345 RepID=UPI003688229F